MNVGIETNSPTLKNRRMPPDRNTEDGGAGAVETDDVEDTGTVSSHHSAFRRVYNFALPGRVFARRSARQTAHEPSECLSRRRLQLPPPLFASPANECEFIAAHLCSHSPSPVRWFIDPRRFGL